MGYLDIKGHNGFLNEFCDLYNPKILINSSYPFKNLDFPTSIDVMLTTLYRRFHNSCAIEKELSDFHKMTFTVVQTRFRKKEPKAIQYRNYFNFSAEEYRQYSLSHYLVKIKLDKVSIPF